MKNHLGLRAYNMQKSLHLEPLDMLRRREYGDGYKVFFDANPDVQMLWSDEAAFTLNGNIG